MNKKVSTLLTVAMMLGGSLLSSSAFALPVNGANTVIETSLRVAGELPTTPIATDAVVKNGQAVLLIANNQVLAWDAAQKKAVMKAYDADAPAIWYLDIDAVTGKAHLVNAEGQYLVQDANANAYGFEVSLTEDANNKGSYTLTTGWQAITLTNVGAAASVMVSALPENPITSTEDLNTWYNGKGFNFAAKGTDVQGNLFGTDKVIFSYSVQNTAYELESQGGNKIEIPVGTYFFTDVKFLEGKGAADITVDATNTNAKYIDWLNSTLIAVSSTQASEATDSDRAAGEGFELIERLGSDFNFQVTDDVPQGDDVAINNAAFTVNKQAGQDYPYALSLADFYYQAKGADYATEDQKSIKSVKVAVESYTNSGVTTNLVVSKVNSSNLYAFKFSNSAILNVRTLLKDTKEAAVYTIQFVNGAKDDSKLINKYLTVGKGSSAFQMEAKPIAIFDATMPIFQWVITDVEDGAKNADGEMEYKTAKFTNRETGKSFKTKLFKEGDGLYSMALAQNMNVTPFTVEEDAAQNTYAVKADGNARAINSNVIIKLAPVEVDEHAGFLDVEDGTIRTMAFARDKYTTSNRLFAAVIPDAAGTGKELNKDDEFATEVSEAAQWKLMKISEEEISRTFVYNNTSTHSADRVANGDKVKAYVYALRYVEDGSETNFFLSNANKNQPTATRALKDYSSNPVNDSEDMDVATTYDDAKFLIKENVDGSVTLIAYDDASTMANSVVAPNAEAKSLDATYNTASKEYEYVFSDDNDEYVYGSASESNDVRVYLDYEHKEISWQAEEGHITLLSEMGNYVNMNEYHDAIEVDETDANVYYLHVTDKKAVVPSFYISLGTKEGGNAESERMYMFNPQDSINYYVADGTYDKKYQWSEENKKLIFKAATMNETRDTLTTNIKGEVKKVAMKADNNDKNVFGGLNRFKFQIVETEDADGYYYIRQTKAAGNATQYLASHNSKMTWTANKQSAMKFTIKEAEAPTSNENVAASEVKVIANNGSINVKNAAGKNVVVSTILGQVVANEVLTSDNATINVPAGIVVVSVEGESFKINVR